MESRSGRKPVSNFFIKKSLQMGLIMRIVTVTIFSTLIASAVIFIVYYAQHRMVLFYQLDPSGNLTKENILFLILPSLVISMIVNIILGITLGLYASRKYAVPVYKLEQWARRVREGKLHSKLRFREQEEMSELSEECNLLTDDIRGKFAELQRLFEGLPRQESAQYQQARAILATLDFSLEVEKKP